MKFNCRVYSTVIGNGRTLQNDTVICGYNIPKGVRRWRRWWRRIFFLASRLRLTAVIKTRGWFLCTFQVQVVFPTLVTGNMEQWVDDAKTFKPSRWLKDASNDKLHPFASLPYGYGARMCLGRRFADLEMQVLLAKVSFSFLSNFYFCTVNNLADRAKRLNRSLYFSAHTILQIGVPSRTSEVQSYLHVRTGWRPGI